MKLVLILNPAAGTKQGKRYLADLISLFSDYGYDCLTFVTRARGEATELAARHGADADLVVAIGGDGTFNEVLSGMMRIASPCPIGYLPAGSTNDLGASLGLGHNIMQTAQAIMTGVPRELDIGRFDDRYFTYVASFGLFTKASYSAPQELKNLLGHAAYVLEGMKDLWAIKPEHLRIETEDEVFEDDYIFGAISNSTSVGGILTLSDEIVNLSDGLFELLLIRMPKSMIELNQIIISLRQRNYDNEMILLKSIRSATLHCSPEMPWTLDGEFKPGAAVSTIENLRGKIRVLVPKSGAAETTE